jgi:hypothetical protein
MATSYDLVIRNTSGTEIGRITEFVSIHPTRVVNAQGACEIVIFSQTEQRIGFLIGIDMWIEIWRRDPLVASSSVVGDTAYFVRKVVRTRDRTVVTCADALSLLDRRIIAYAAEEPEADKSGTADDVIKAYVRENMSTLATDTNRIISTDLFTVDGDLSLSQSITKAAAWGNLLAVCQELASTATTLGTYTAFDITAPYGGGPPLRFSTFTQWRGTDRRLATGSNLVLSEEAGTLLSVTVATDFTNAITVGYAGGQGQGAARYVATAISDYAAWGPFGRIERFSNASYSADASTSDDEADALVRGNRPRIIFEADMANLHGCAYGIDWDFGDYVTAYAFGRTYECRIDALDLTVANGKETFKTLLRAEVEL